MIKKGNLFI